MGAVRMMEQPQVVPLQQQAPPSMGNAVAAETQGRLGSRAASSNTTGTWRTGWPAPFATCTWQDQADTMCKAVHDRNADALPAH